MRYQTLYQAAVIKEKKSEHRPFSWFTWYYASWDKLRFIYSPYSSEDYRKNFNISLFGLSLHFYLNFWKSKEEGIESPQYGLYWFEDSLVLCWGKKSKHLQLPGTLKYYRQSLLVRGPGKDVGWEQDYFYWVDDYSKWSKKRKGPTKEFWKDNWKDRAYTLEAPYFYAYRKGEEDIMIQKTKATVTVKEMEWRRFRWTKLGRLIRRSIEIDFEIGIGEGVERMKYGSPCGTLGCSYEMKTNEKPLETLRRMERERVFT